MFLVYTDESGKDLKKSKDGTYRDGPCFIYGGLAIKANKTHMLEDAFKSLCKEILGINNIYEDEIHTGDVFYGKKRFSNLDLDKKIEFFKEILQLLSKFNIPLLAGVVYKDTTLFSSDLEKTASAIYAFFSVLDWFLLKQNSSGVIIADEIEKDIKSIKELLNDNNLVGKRGGIKLSFLLRRIYYERLIRFKEYNFSPLISIRYKFESQIYALTDNIHYVSSKLSTFNQLSDIFLFLLNLHFEQEGYKKILPEKEQLISSIKEDFEHFLTTTESALSFMAKVKGNYDVILKIFSKMDYLSKENLAEIFNLIKKAQASGT